MPHGRGGFSGGLGADLSGFSGVDSSFGGGGGRGGSANSGAAQMERARAAAAARQAAAAAREQARQNSFIDSYNRMVGSNIPGRGPTDGTGSETTNYDSARQSYANMLGIGKSWEDARDSSTGFGSSFRNPLSFVPGFRPSIQYSPSKSKYVSQSKFAGPGALVSDALGMIASAGIPNPVGAYLANKGVSYVADAIGNASGIDLAGGLDTLGNGVSDATSQVAGLDANNPDAVDGQPDKPGRHGLFDKHDGGDRVAFFKPRTVGQTAKAADKKQELIKALMGNVSGPGYTRAGQGVIFT